MDKKAEELLFEKINKIEREIEEIKERIKLRDFNKCLYDYNKHINQYIKDFADEYIAANIGKYISEYSEEK